MSYVFSKEDDYSLIPEGEYECILESIEERRTQSGKENLSLRFRIRTDIEGQEQGNRVIFETIWKEKDNPEFYNRKRLNRLIGSVIDVEDGEQFEDIQDIIERIRTTPVICVVGIFDNDYTGKQENRIKYWKPSIKRAKALEVKTTKKDPFKPVIEIDDEDVPF